MNISKVDPRDISWEIPNVSYRVYFNSSNGTETSEYQLTDADVKEVLAWAELEGSHNGEFVVYACVECSGERGLLRLASSHVEKG